MTIRRTATRASLVALSALGLACGGDPVAAAAATALASDGGSDDGACKRGPYPGAASVAVGWPLPDLSFEGIDELGRPRQIHAHEYYEPCVAAARLLVVRVNGGAWCGTCVWHAAHTGEIASHRAGSRLRLLDLVIGNRDNEPARVADLAGWRDLVDRPERVAMAVDPGFSLRPLLPIVGTIMPLYVFIDTKTMNVLSQFANPDPADLARQIELAMAAVDGTAAPPPIDEKLIDGRFHRNEWDMLREVAAPGAPPADPTNAAADRSAAAALGKLLFRDATLSPSGRISCASCHEPTKQLSDGLPQAMGAARGNRRTARIALSAFSRYQFWDGRADSAWSQALGPFENPDEMASTRTFVVRKVADKYRSQYDSAFPAYPLPTTGALPATGKPGDAEYDALSPTEQANVTRVFVNVGKAIAAYERTFRTRPNALDAYTSGDFTALSGIEKQGLSVFIGAGCMQCHWGPRLTDDAFHVTRTPTGRRDGRADRGRADVAGLAPIEFAASSSWSDDPSFGRASSTFDAMVGAFKTPPLRGVANAAPYGHGGMLPSLADIMDVYGTGGLPADDPRATGRAEPWLARFDVTAQWSIVAFLNILSAEPIVR